MLSEDTGEFTDDRPWVSEGTLERFEANRRGLWFFQWSCMDVSWTVKKAEHQKIDASELWCWRRFLRVPWTARWSSQSVRNSDTLATSCEELTHWKRHWRWEGLGTGGEGYDRGWDVWMASPTQWTWVWVNSGSWWWTGRPGMLRFMGSQRFGHDGATELNWPELQAK